MATGKRFIKILGVTNIIYIVMRGVINMEDFTILDFRSTLITIVFNLFWTSAIIYAIYKRINIARLLLSGICVLALFDNVAVYLNGLFGINEILSTLVTVSYLVILANADVIKYVRSSKKGIRSRY